MTQHPAGPPCGNNPNYRLSDGDRQAVAEFRAYLADRAALRDRPAETEEERADREETERDHARGDHTHCGITCEAEMPTEHLRNFVIAKGYPGTKGALDELLRRARAAAVLAVLPEPSRAAVLREFLPRLEERLLGCCQECNACAAIARDLAAEMAAAAQQQPGAEAPSDRAAIYREIADRLAADAEKGDKEGLTRIYRRSAATQVRAWADELLGPVVQQPAAADDAHRIVAYVLTVGTDLHCLACTPTPRGDIWAPVTAEELEDGGLCARCGRDLLIQRQTATADDHVCGDAEAQQDGAQQEADRG